MLNGTPGFQGLRLKQSRVIRRKNITTLANELGLSKASVSAYEQCLRTPSPETMGKICKVLEFPLDFFLSDPKKIVENDKPAMWRSYLSATQMARSCAVEKCKIFVSIAAYLYQYVNLPALNIPKFDVPSDPTSISDEDIQNIVKKTRKYWGLSLGPISNIVCLLENNGLIVAKFPFECEKLDAFSVTIDGYPIVVIGSDKGSAVRQRFDVAHELGHFLLHRNVPKDDLESKKFHNILEQQANYFAFDFLFPTEAFESEVKRISLNDFMYVKRKWKVSISSLILNSVKKNFSSPDETRNLFRSLARRGWDKIEPFDDEFACEEPRLIKEALQLVLDSGIQEPPDIYKQFCLNFYDIESIAGLPKGYLSSFQNRNTMTLKEKYSKPSSQSADSTAKSKSSNVVSFLDAYVQRK
jgi:Zn-dependent peptidase ImmA (M78 family)/DNA-binding XRE family transcriptional regulator